MLILEALLLTIVISTLFYSAYTDCTTGLIKNRIVFYSLEAVIFCDFIYYCFYGQDYFAVFLQNVAILTFIALVFYYLKIWGGGDSKLLILVALAIPGRLYSLNSINNSSVLIVAFAFASAFIVIVIHSLCLGIKNKDLFKVGKMKFDIKRMLISYFMMISIMQLCNAVIQMFFSDFALNNWILVQLLNCVMIFALVNLQNRLSKVQILVIGLFSVASFVMLCLSKGMLLVRGINWNLVPMTFGVVLLRILIAKYSYKIIPTEKIKAGDILSASTVVNFQFSRVKGLPMGITEDLSSKITEEEAQSIYRWKNSVNGADTVVIVRKIPFAIYITLGTVGFIIFEVLSA